MIMVMTKKLIKTMKLIKMVNTTMMMMMIIIMMMM
jgi:hypothetical protein